MVVGPVRFPVVTSSVSGSPLVSGRLIDHIGLGVLSARFDRDLLEKVINRTGCREKRTAVADARDDPVRHRDGPVLRRARRRGDASSGRESAPARVLVDDWQVPTRRRSPRRGPAWGRSQCGCCSTGRRYRWPVRVRRVRGWPGAGLDSSVGPSAYAVTAQVATGGGAGASPGAQSW